MCTNTRLISFRSRLLPRFDLTNFHNPILSGSPGIFPCRRLHFLDGGLTDEKSGIRDARKTILPVCMNPVEQSFTL